MGVIIKVPQERRRSKANGHLSKKQIEKHRADRAIIERCEAEARAERERIAHAVKD